jgi:hypothetical protein
LSCSSSFVVVVEGNGFRDRRCLGLRISFPQSRERSDLGFWRRDNEDAPELALGAAEIATTGRLQQETDRRLGQP